MTDHPAEGKLLTCPFCGKLDAFAERFDLSSCYIQCNDCGAQGPTCCQDSDDEEMPGEDAARRAWNTRHSQGANATTSSPAVSAEEIARALFDVTHEEPWEQGMTETRAIYLDCLSG